MMQRILICGLVAAGLAGMALAEDVPSPQPAGPVVAEKEKPLPEGFDPRRHMLVSEVRPGMIGYGMTVFHGTKPEPFPVEVISIETDSSPGKSVIWIRCPGERMQLSGPVHGMSGSPIYLWPRGVKRASMRIGQDGRIIGAFAFGFEFGKDCYVGVQPIENMLRAAARAGKSESDSDEAAMASMNHDSALALALAAADRLKWPDATTWQMKAIAKVAGIKPAESQVAAERKANWRGAHDAMALPLMAGNSDTAMMLQPLLAGTGLSAVSGGAEQAMGGAIPRWIENPDVQPQPGGVLSVPMVSGDADMAVSGTITDVIEKNGKQMILAFGHAFTGQGAERLPIATGYVHFVQPSAQSSFKLGGSLHVFGSLVNDENVGVMGVTGEKAPTHPATVTVEWPDPSKNHTYHFQIADHPTYTPMLSAAVVSRSLTADTNWPDHSTLLLKSEIDFGDGKVLRIDRILPEPDAQSVMSSILPALSVLTDSPFGKMRVRSMNTTVKVVPESMVATISNVVIQNTTVKPGESVNIDVELQPFQGTPYVKRISFPVPADQPEGNYTMFVGGVDAYLQQHMRTHPHLGQVSNQSELFDVVRYILSLRGDVMYSTLIPQDRQSVAVGRTEMDKLPSSRAAMLLQPTNSLASPFLQTLDHQTQMDQVVTGEFAFPLIVEKQPGNVKPQQP